MKLLGALVTHVGSGISHEVRSGLQAMALLASKYSHELIPLSSHIMGKLTDQIFPVKCSICFIAKGFLFYFRYLGLFGRI